MHGALSKAEIAAMDAYWRAANYLSVGQIYLLDNPSLREPLHDTNIPLFRFTMNRISAG